MNNYKISEAEIQQNNVKSAQDTLDGSPQENKAVFDKLPELIANRFNGLTEYVFGKIYTKEDIDKIAGEKCDVSQVYTKKEVYTKNETDQKINNAVFDSKNSDMQKAVYDKNNDGVVDSAEQANLAENAVCFGGQQPSYYAKQTDMALAEEDIAKIKSDLAFSLYTHTAGSLTGGGANGKFKATVSETVTKLNVNGVSCTIKSGSEIQMELIAGCWYTFILDGTTVNFSGGGAGISKSKLVDALQYSGLGITINSTSSEIIQALKNEFPAYEDVINTETQAEVKHWSAKSYNNNTSEVYGSVSPTEGLVFTVNNNYGRFTEQFQRDFARYSKIEIDVTREQIANGLNTSFFGIIENRDAAVPVGNGSHLNPSVAITANGTFTLDLTSYNKAGYLALQIPTKGRNRITKIRLYR